MKAKRGFCRICNSYLGVEPLHPGNLKEFCNRCTTWGMLTIILFIGVIGIIIGVLLSEIVKAATR